MNEPYINEECIVLKRRPYNESDAIIIFYGKKTGKFRAFSKGLEKPASKLTSLLNVGNIVFANLFEGKSGLTLLSASQIENSQHDYFSYEALLTSVYICDLVDEGIPVAVQQEELFDLIVDVIRKMNDQNFVECRLYFEWFFLNYSGYASASGEEFYEMWKLYWKTDGLSVFQQSLVDEIYTLLSIGSGLKKGFSEIRLSKSARREFRAFLNLMYKKYIDVQIKSKRILDEATIHFYS